MFSAVYNDQTVRDRGVEGTQLCVCMCVCLCVRPRHTTESVAARSCILFRSADGMMMDGFFWGGGAREWKLLMLPSGSVTLTCAVLTLTH